MKIRVLILVVLGLIYGCCNRPDYVLEGTYPIKSIRTSETIEGEFFLGSGSFGGHTYFYSYVEIRPGSFQLKRYQMEKTTISETDSYPRVLIYKYTWTPNDGDAAVFMVPKGTIVEKFRLE
jgi:hypothetical protein